MRQHKAFSSLKQTLKHGTYICALSLALATPAHAQNTEAQFGTAFPGRAEQQIGEIQSIGHQDTYAITTLDTQGDQRATDPPRSRLEFGIGNTLIPHNNTVTVRVSS